MHSKDDGSLSGRYGGTGRKIPVPVSDLIECVYGLDCVPPPSNYHTTNIGPQWRRQAELLQATYIGQNIPEGAVWDVETLVHSIDTIGRIIVQTEPESSFADISEEHLVNLVGLRAYLGEARDFFMRQKHAAEQAPVPKGKISENILAFELSHAGANERNSAALAHFKARIQMHLGDYVPREVRDYPKQPLAIAPERPKEYAAPEV